MVLPRNDRIGDLEGQVKLCPLFSVRSHTTLVEDTSCRQTVMGATKGKVANSLGLLLSQPKSKSRLYPGQIICESTVLGTESELTVQGVFLNERPEESLVTAGLPQVITPTATSQAL